MNGHQKAWSYKKKKRKKMKRIKKAILKEPKDKRYPLNQGFKRGSS